MSGPERIRFKPALYAAAGAILLPAAAWFARMPIADFAAETWLAHRGVQAQVNVSRLDFGGVAAKLRLGDPDRPDFSAERVSLSFAAHGWFAMQSLELRRPFLRAHFDGNKLSFGQLQTLIDSFAQPKSAAAPSASATAQPPRAPLAIRIDHALVQVDAPEGRMKISGDANLNGTKFASAHATVEPASLRGAHFEAAVKGGSLVARQTGEGLQLSAGFRGSMKTATLDVENADIALDAQSVRWTQTQSGLRVSGTTQTQVSAARAAYGDYAFANLHAAAKASGVVGSDMSLDVRFDSDVTGDSVDGTAKKLAAKIPAGDARMKRAVAAALQSVHADIAAHLTRANGQSVLALEKPATIAGKNGAVLTIAPVEGALVTAGENGISGAARITLKGRGLPTIALGLPAFAMHDDGSFSAQTALDARFTALGLTGAHIVSDGALTGTNDTIAYTPDGCARIAVAAVAQKGKAVLERLRASLCPVPEQNLLSIADGGWSLNARLRGTSADITSAQTGVANAAARVQIAANKAGALNGTVHLASAALRDLANSPRFKPLSASGKLSLGGNRVTGTIALASGKQELASIAIDHSLKSGKGHADIAARGLDFKPDGLQPADISPLLAQLSHANGSVRFDGRIAWTKKGTTSGGELDMDGLEFQTPLGAASGASTHITFTSLVPLQTAPDQKIAISHIAWITPLTDAVAQFQLEPGMLHLTGAGTDVAKGRVTLDPMSVPFAPGETFKGAIRLSHVDLGAIVAASNLADKISIKAHIEGVVPFSMGPEGLRLSDGQVQSLAPGTLSIKRSLWSGAGDSGGKTNAIRDFAFQALEHLAIDTMSGKLESLPGGRLRVVLNIKGYNDPPHPVETRVDIFSLWNGTAFDKPLPLPAKTPVDLTLDTSLNFDELLRAYRNAWQADQADTTGTKP